MGQASKGDRYAAKYMGGGQLALTRKAMPWWYHGVFLFIGAVVITAAALSGAWFSLLTLPLVGLMWILFTHARVAVTREHVQVQLGVFGPKIPIARIERAEAAKYDAAKFGGYGIKWAEGTTAYSVAGGNGMGVRIEFADADGKKRALFVSSNEPDTIVQAIAEARAAKSPKRVGGGAAAEVDAEAGDERAAEERRRAT